MPGTSLSGSTSTGGNSQTPVLPSGSTFNVRIISLVPVGSGALLASPNAQGALTGTVTGTTPTGQTIVQTPLGEIALSARSTLPRGTQLNLHMMGTPKFPMGTGDTSSLLLSQQWETLKDAMAAIQSSDPAAARNMTQQILPQAGGAMTTGMLFFLSAMMTGDLRRWMGEEAMRILQRSRQSAWSSPPRYRRNAANGKRTIGSGMALLYHSSIGRGQPPTAQTLR